MYHGFKYVFHKTDMERYDFKRNSVEYYFEPNAQIQFFEYFATNLVHIILEKRG